jgi:hypothetical protein
MQGRHPERKRQVRVSWLAQEPFTRLTADLFPLGQRPRRLQNTNRDNPQRS